MQRVSSRGQHNTWFQPVQWALLGGFGVGVSGQQPSEDLSSNPSLGPLLPPLSPSHPQPLHGRAQSAIFSGSLCPIRIIMWMGSEGLGAPLSFATLWNFSQVSPAFASDLINPLASFEGASRGVSGSMMCVGVVFLGGGPQPS